jgi:hypothetical protein
LKDAGIEWRDPAEFGIRENTDIMRREPDLARIKPARFTWPPWHSVVTILTPILFCLLAYDNLRFVERLFSADSLVLAAFVWESWHFSDVWSWFQLPRVPSLFPDLAVYWVIQSIFDSWRAAHFAYGLFSLLALTWLAGAIIGRCVGCGIWRGINAFLLIIIPVLSFELTQNVHGEFPLHNFLFMPAFHSGQFVLSLGASVLLWHSIERPDRVGLLILIGLLGIAGAISDKMFLLEFHTPALATVFVLCLAGAAGWRQVIEMVALSVTGVAAVLLGDRFLVLQPLPNRQWRAMPGNVTRFLHGPFTELAVLTPWTAVLCYATPFVLACVVLVLPFRRSQANVQGWARNVVAFWWLMALTSIVLTSGATALVYNSWTEYRYAQPLLWWPLIFTGAGLASLLARWRVQIGAASVGIMSCIMAGMWLTEGVHSPGILDWRYPLSTCLIDLKKTEGLNAGLSEFWFGTFLMGLSDWRMQTEPISPLGAAVYWGNDPRWFTHDIHDPGRVPEYNFIIMTHAVEPQSETEAVSLTSLTGYGVASYIGLPEDHIRDSFGPPDKVLHCPSLWAHASALWGTGVNPTPETRK